MSTGWFGWTPPTATKKATAARQEAQTTSNTQNVAPGLDASRDNFTITDTPVTSNFTPVTYAPPAAPAPVVPAKTDAEYLAEDSIFQAQKNALQAALDAYLADTAAQRSTYNTNYGESLRKLGFTGDQGALDKAKWDPAENEGKGRWEDAEGNPLAANISWNQTDKNTAAGRGFQNTLNDFASRGMLQSSAYQRAYNNLQRQLNEQLASTASARQTALGEFDRGDAAKKAEKTTAEATASQEALARIKAAYGIG